MTLQAGCEQQTSLAGDAPAGGAAESTTRSVRVNPSGISLEVGRGESLLDAAVRLGYHWTSTCHGLAECGSCFVRVERGEDQLSPCASDEDERLDKMPNRHHRRLACRVFIEGDGVVVFKPGVRPKT